VGVLSIILGLALMGAVVDVVVENDIATAVQQPLTVAGTTQHVSPPVLAAIAFAAGAFGVVLIVLGIRRMRHAGRAQLQERIRTLQDENARLHTQRHLENIVRIPEAAPVASEKPEPAPVASERPVPPKPEPQPDQSATNTKW
jgi:cell division septation protein DedD